MPCSVYKLLHCKPKHEEGPYLYTRAIWQFIPIFGRIVLKSGVMSALHSSSVYVVDGSAYLRVAMIVEERAREAAE